MVGLSKLVKQHIPLISNGFAWKLICGPLNTYLIYSHQPAQLTYTGFVQTAMAQGPFVCKYLKGLKPRTDAMPCKCDAT